MKFSLAIILVALFITGCQSSGDLKPVSKIKPSVAEEGSLANEKLIADTTVGLRKVAGGSVIDSNSKILKFVIQQPVGKVGERAWRELWIVDPEGKSLQYIITFKEAGLGAADFEIQSN